MTKNSSSFVSQSLIGETMRSMRQTFVDRRCVFIGDEENSFFRQMVLNDRPELSEILSKRRVFSPLSEIDETRRTKSCSGSFGDRCSSRKSLADRPAPNVVDDPMRLTTCSFSRLVSSRTLISFSQSQTQLDIDWPIDTTNRNIEGGGEGEAAAAQVSTDFFISH